MKKEKIWIGFALIAVILITVVVVEQRKLVWAEWTGFGEDVEETRTQEIQPNGKVAKITISKKIQSGKTLWDWLSVLGVPLSLAVLGFWFQQQEQKRANEKAELEKKIAESNQREEILQSYFDRLSDLLVDRTAVEMASSENNVLAEKKKLLETAIDIVQARTLSILRQFGEDEERKMSVIQFLIEVEIFSKLKLHLGSALKGVYLSGANLSGAYFSGANLSSANLSGANLSSANLTGANLNRTNLSGANLERATLYRANLSEANITAPDLPFVVFRPSKTNLSGAYLKEADLTGANLTGAYLNKADLTGACLTGAIFCQTTMPDGTINNSGCLVIHKELDTV